MAEEVNCHFATLWAEIWSVCASEAPFSRQVPFIVEFNENSSDAPIKRRNTSLALKIA